MFIRCSIIINHPFRGTPFSGNPHIWNHPPVRATVFASVCSFVKRFCGHPCGWPPHHLDWATPTGVANTALCIAGSWQCDGFYVGFLQKLTFLWNKHELKCCLCVCFLQISQGYLLQKDFAYTQFDCFEPFLSLLSLSSPILYLSSGQITIILKPQICRNQSEPSSISRSSLVAT